MATSLVAHRTVRYLQESKCEPPYDTRECFLDDHTIVGVFNVTFDAAYGPYLRCNPNFIQGDEPYLNMSDWLCAYGYDPPPPSLCACSPTLCSSVT